MNTNYAICQIADQITKISNRIKTLSASISDLDYQEKDEIAETFESQRMGQLADLQQLLIVLTGLIVPNDAVLTETNSDEGSIFAEGELEDNIGDKTDGKGECK